MLPALSPDTGCSSPPPAHFAVGFLRGVEEPSFGALAQDYGEGGDPVGLASPLAQDVLDRDAPRH